MILEMIVKGENRFDAEMIYQGKAQYCSLNYSNMIFNHNF